jgi:magnesium-transporting ATPase (P-type)
VTYIFASNVPELIPFILFVMFKIPLPLTVMQILAIDLGTDLIPALGLGAEAPEPGIMNHPPRSQNERLINTRLFIRSYVFLGGIEAALCMAAYYFLYWTSGWRWGMPLAAGGPVYIMATTMCLAGIVASQVGNVFCCRTDRESIFKVGFFKNKLVLFGIASEITLILIFVYTPFFQRVFGTAPLALKDWVFLLTFSPIILLLEEGRKWFIRRRPIGKITIPLKASSI